MSDQPHGSAQQIEPGFRNVASYFLFGLLLISSLSVPHASALNLVTQREPTEGAFQIDIPQGWQTHLGLVRKNGAAQTWVRAVGPGQGNEWFVGDPNMAFFVDPRSIDPQMAQYLRMGGVRRSCCSKSGF